MGIARFARVVFGALLLAACSAATAWSIGGTDTIVGKISGEKSWPKGLADFLNQPCRTEGTRRWRSGGPTSSNYCFKIASIDELNQLVTKFAEIDSPDLQLIVIHPDHPWPSASASLSMNEPPAGKRITLFVMPRTKAEAELIKRPLKLQPKLRQEQPQSIGDEVTLF